MKGDDGRGGVEAEFGQVLRWVRSNALGFELERLLDNVINGRRVGGLLAGLGKLPAVAALDEFDVAVFHRTVDPVDAVERELEDARIDEIEISFREIFGGVGFEDG